MHGGVKFYRGAARAARSYVERDRSRADDYYLGEGSGVAARIVAGRDGVELAGPMTGETYERWVAGFDVETNEPKGRLRTDANALRFVEVTINGPKTWSLAAAMHPDVSAALDAAQDRAAAQVVGWVAQHATTRVGPRGRQVQVPVERIEAAVIRHYTSRAGDPHRHLHLQINARVFAAGAWRGIHSVGIRDSIEAINGIGHAAVASDPEFRAVLSACGFTLDPETGEIRQLAPYVGAFSARTAQIRRNIDRYEAQWRSKHLGEEPGPRMRESWDRRAWAEARPDKVVPRDGAALVTRWNEELRALGYRDPARPLWTLEVPGPRIGELDRDLAVELVLSRLGSKRSAWNAADVRGHVEGLLAQLDLVAQAAVRVELAEDLTARAIERSASLLTRDDVPEHVRALTSAQVLNVEHELMARMARRAQAPARFARLHWSTRDRLDPGQARVVSGLAGDAQLLVIEGAAGAGKTTTLAAARQLLAVRGRRLVVTTPTMKAAEVAGRETGADGHSAAWFIYQHGWRWDDDGHWQRFPGNPPLGAQLRPGDLLLVDEAGMLDQDTALALLTIADESGARIAFMGDRHQLPAVGRGGVLDLATTWAHPTSILNMDRVHRFADPVDAAISLKMRSGTDPGLVFDALRRRGRIAIHHSDVERTAALADLAAARDDLVIADSREQVALLNAANRDRRSTRSGGRSVTTARGEEIGTRDRVATRRNAPTLGVANRQTWTVTRVDDDGSVVVHGRGRDHQLPADYVRDHVELAFATTAYGAQGETVDRAHAVIGESTSAAAAYVGMTRGRHSNVAHLVAENLEDARAQWIDVFGRDRADLGAANARQRAIDNIDRYGRAASQRRVQLDPPAYRPTARHHGPGLGI